MSKIFRIAGNIFLALFIAFILFGIIRASRRMITASTERNSPHILLLPLAGPIYSSAEFNGKIAAALKDSAVKAVVVRINSPGGLVAPSQEIYQAIKRADEKIPVVISMGPLAASGGYYAALGGRKIYASPGTLTGSIGVIMQVPNFTGLLSWAKIRHYTITSGKFKDVGSPFRDMLPEERQLIMQMVQDIYAQFRADVQKHRKLSDGDLDRVADGRVLTGRQAHAAQLIDELGGLYEAGNGARNLAGLPPSIPIRYPESKGGLLRQLLWGDEEPNYDEAEDEVKSAVQKIASGAAMMDGWRILLMSQAH